MEVVQKVMEFKPRPRGVHVVTGEILEEIPEVEGYKFGQVNLFLKGRGVALSVNESVCENVLTDFNDWLDDIAPDQRAWKFNPEARGEMSSNVKASLVGVSLTIPIINGAIDMGTWQGIYLDEHREDREPRELVLTVIGVPVDE